MEATQLDRSGEELVKEDADETVRKVERGTQGSDSNDELGSDLQSTPPAL